MKNGFKDEQSQKKTDDQEDYPVGIFSRSRRAFSAVGG